ncbi:MAG TPA: TerB family tellurite resistance protein [Candidatus Binatia bacterium]|nr:TerB family tellurite resistance protein [Candidatus Binatia bacterium]
MPIADFLGLNRRKAATSAQTETVRKIVAALDSMDQDQAKYVASFAFILCRVARADLEVSEHEQQAMEEIVMKLGGLPEEQAVLVVQMAKTQNMLFGGTENFLVTREFNKLATREQKLSLLECLFAVSSSDESISQTEDNEISRVCSELQLPHEDRIAARSRYREHLAVLKLR